MLPTAAASSTPPLLSRPLLMLLANMSRAAAMPDPPTYPHRYNNYEGFDFPVDGPYNEFPILKSGRIYSGGSPGPDRVVISDGCDLAGVITHTGASGNNFVACSGTS
ncbi:hypothetical protein J3458_004285 [Metarhizium acridum]|uniref:uncharacterized protein n=1 Tax=Metarhizium acridum TaxID=92637 RepID=UPI001C6C9AFB|nr:hypothetical protein J3458_004285 [Metarhizium acridum]